MGGCLGCTGGSCAACTGKGSNSGKNSQSRQPQNTFRQLDFQMLIGVSEERRRELLEEYLGFFSPPAPTQQKTGAQGQQDSPQDSAQGEAAQKGKIAVSPAPKVHPASLSLYVQQASRTTASAPIPAPKPTVLSAPSKNFRQRQRIARNGSEQPLSHSSALQAQSNAMQVPSPIAPASSAFQPQLARIQPLQNRLSQTMQPSQQHAEKAKAASAPPNSPAVKMPFIQDPKPRRLRPSFPQGPKPAKERMENTAPKNPRRQRSLNDAKNRQLLGNLPKQHSAPKEKSQKQQAPNEKKSFTHQKSKSAGSKQPQAKQFRPQRRKAHPATPELSSGKMHLPPLSEPLHYAKKPAHSSLNTAKRPKTAKNRGTLPSARAKKARRKSGFSTFARA